jgi:hypothetical protein
MLDKNSQQTSDVKEAAPRLKKVRVFENNIPDEFDWIEGEY